jgi:hypothetical protein
MSPCPTTIYAPEIERTHPAQAAFASMNGAPKGETCGGCVHYRLKGNGKLGQRARCGLADRMLAAVKRAPYRGNYPLPASQPAYRFWQVRP